MAPSTDTASHRNFSSIKPDYGRPESVIPKRSAFRILSDLADNRVLEVLEESRGRQPASYQFPDPIRIVGKDV